MVRDARAAIGECPLWDPREGVLWWVDIPTGRLHQFDPQDDTDRVIEVGEDLGAVALREKGGLVLALRSGFAVLEQAGVIRRLTGIETTDQRLRLNDARCDSRGRLWAGTVRDDQVPGTAGLYRLDPDGTVTRQLDGITISNGMDWSPDSRHFYYADSGAGTVSVFDYDLDRGELGKRRLFARIEPRYGFPDGLCVDSAGFIWVAVFGAWSVHRYSPDGRLDAAIHVPARDVTSVAFGGDDLDVLYITSARERLGATELNEQPLAGALFRCSPGARGRAQSSWAG